MIFEYRLAAMLFSRMLRRAHVPVGIQQPIERVALQQRIVGSAFDDIVLQTGDALQGPSIEIQVKKRLAVSGSNTEFVKVMESALTVCRSREKDLTKGALLLGLAVGDPATDLEALSELTAMARAHPDATSLGRLLSEGVTRSSLRSRHRHVVTAVATAATTTDITKAETLTHQILSALHVWHVQIAPDGRDWRAELDQVSDLASSAGQSADSVMGRLYDLAQEAGPKAGSLDIHMVCAALLRRFGLDLSTTIRDLASSRSKMINIINTGSGTFFSAESQVFNGLRIGR
ncbi:hypothetical protein AB0H88_14570 [Nonomuraea sp. NPDC050680]|uniref:hypothetical protein n=1 Tax=Nonomuraea sp. NPDC050680 TaxID=3154630 RepID=UPI0033EBC897